MNVPHCARCRAKPCKLQPGERGPLPPDCPITCFAPLVEEVKREYEDKDIFHFFLQSAVTEKECYDPDEARRGRIRPLRPRIREIAEFAHKISAKRIGMAFCAGLSDEALRANTILEKHGLDVVSVVCSCGAVDKTELGIPKTAKIYGENRFEAACNPILQAEILNRAETAFNVIVGLCVGHDMLFTQRSRAPVTTLIVKDRLTGHNPVITLYSRYHKDIV